MAYNHNIEQKGFGLETEAVIEEVKNNFKAMIGKRKDSILILGQALEKVLKLDSICEEIKNILDDEIKQGIISRRLIEKYCLDKWKKITSPRKKITHSESEKISLLAKDEMVAAIGTSGNTKCVSAEEPEKSSGKSDIDASERNTTSDLKFGTNNNAGNKQLIQFRLSIPFTLLQEHMAKEFRIHQGTEPVLIRANIDKISGIVSAVSLIPSSDNVDDSDSNDDWMPEYFTV
jgi:hypothetical protein